MRLLSAPQALDILRGTSSWSKRQSIAIMVSGKSAGVVSD